MILESLFKVRLNYLKLKLIEIALKMILQDHTHWNLLMEEHKQFITFPVSMAIEFQSTNRSPTKKLIKNQQVEKLMSHWRRGK